MTTKERVIVSAYTGIRMCDMDLIEAYVQEKLGRPVLSNEWGDQRFHEIVQAMVIFPSKERERDTVCEAD